jgi:hypothetical protein
MGVSGHRHSLAALCPQGKEQEVVSAPAPVWTQRLEEQFFVSAGDRTPIAPIQSVVRHYTDWATPKSGRVEMQYY